MGKEGKFCRKCNVGLVSGENWYRGRAKRYDYICARCHPRSPKSPLVKRAGKIRERNRRRGANNPCSYAEALGIAEEFIRRTQGGEAVEVDHIIPISCGGCGCSSNLQVLPIEDHRIKTRQERVWVWLHRQVYQGQ